jgi:putative hemolysin
MKETDSDGFRFGTDGVILLALTAFFNLAEMSLVAARAAALESSADNAAARTALLLKKRPGLFLDASRHRP